MEIKLTKVPFPSGKALLKTLMKTFIFLFCATVFSMTPVELVSQNAKIVVDEDKTVTVDEVFDMITKQTDYSFIYPEDLFKDFPKVELKKGTIRATKVLNDIIANSGLNVIVTENNSILINKNKTQQIQVSGKVTNENGEPVVGATVLIKGTSRGTATDDNGNYTLLVPNPENVMVFSALGFATQEITVGNHSLINVILKEKVEAFDELIISANLVASKKKEVASAVTVLHSEDIEKLPINNISELFRGEVPGAISFRIGQGSTISSSIKLRGDTEFWSSESTVKIFIDGTEVSSASFLATLPLSAIDRIEVLRGPQASTLYGSGATSGVIYIYTKKGEEGGLHLNAKVSTGIIGSKYVDKTAYQYDHSLNISAGNEGISYNFGGSYLKQDPIWPEGGTTNKNIFGAVKGSSGKFTSEIIGQYSEADIKQSLNPITSETFSNYVQYTTPPNSSFHQVQQTFGANFSYSPFSWWQHNASLGIDQNNVATIQTEPRYTFPSDTLNARNYNNRQKKSYRYFSTFRIPITNNFNTTITAGIDHYKYENTIFYVRGLGDDPNFNIIGSASNTLIKFSNTGFYAQGIFDFYNKLFLTAGIRSESTKQFGNSSGASVAPKFGLSYALLVSEKMSLKLRSSYGKSIKVPNPDYFVAKETDYPQYGYTLVQLENSDLKPQEQKGFDVGFDFEFVKGLGTFEATYYNQNVNNFIKSSSDTSNYPPIILTQYVNVGKITNRGLEFAGSLNLDDLKFRFTYSVTESKVKEITNTNYTRYYQNGDRIWGIPKSSGGANITYNYSSLFKSTGRNLGSLSLGLTYFGSWINQDYVALYTDYNNFIYSNPPSYYAIEYPAITLFRLGFEYHVTNNITCFLNVDNLFNSDAFEFQNTNPTQGRTSIIGVKVNY